MEQHKVTPQPKKDDTFSGLLIIAGIIVIIVGFVYMLSVQKKTEECETAYNPDGTIRAGCALTDPLPSQSPVTDVELLEQLNQDTTSEVDKKLQEAAQDLIKRQKAQEEQKQQESLPAMPM